MWIRETFPTQLTWQWLMNMIKVRWCRFQKCFGTFTMLLLKRSSEKRLIRHLSNHVFRVRNFANTKAVRVNFFFKTFKMSSRFQKCRENWAELFSFWDNCIWIGVVKLSLLKPGYFSSATNVLTSTLKIWNVNKQDFFEHNFVASDQSIW